MIKMAITIKQIWTPYWLWEDWLNGMWNKTEFDIDKAIEFTGNYILYGEAMKIVIDLWPNTMLNSLTNPSVNKRAFLGHCAASYAIKCPEHITRLAWRELTNEQRFLADKVAQETIEEWKSRYINILKRGSSDVIPKIYQTKSQMS